MTASSTHKVHGSVEISHEQLCAVLRFIRESPSLSVNILLKIVMLMSRRLRQTSGQLVDSLEHRETGRAPQ